MQVTEVKTSIATPNGMQPKRQAFFSKEGQNSFFSKSNVATTSFFSPATIQPKLTVGQPNDKYEVEADAMADKVVQQLSESRPQPNTSLIQNKGASPNTVQTKCAECEQEEQHQEKEHPGAQRKPIFESNEEHPDANIQTKCADCAEEKKVQPKSEASHEVASSNLESRLNSSKGGGSPLNSNTKSSMNSAFGADFSKVRIHTGDEAVQMNKELNAQAFTHGNDIYFNQGKYKPTTTAGKHLLAHELTHTLQQNGIDSVQRACDPAALATRTDPMFFPHERNIMRVYQGRSTLRKWGGRNHAVGLVQQALVDLGHG